MNKTFKIETKEDTKRFAQKLAKLITPHFLITMSGDLGAGKTTFTKALGLALGVSKTINSPTFTILKIYQGIMPIYHMDAYRLEGLHQELGFEEVFEDDGLCVVEWSQYIDEQLPKERLHITIEMGIDEARIFNVEAIGPLYEKVLEALQ
ncbi:MAG: tRNA (adenosine(37)-N6)-threonylcarbamoyltransferase complex ATPase subunit type 1 TsaE [Erysipelotrichaceae bacterium]